MCYKVKLLGQNASKGLVVGFLSFLWIIILILKGNCSGLFTARKNSKARKHKKPQSSHSRSVVRWPWRGALTWKEMPGFAPYLWVWAPWVLSWLGRGLSRLPTVVTKMRCPFPGTTVPLTDGTWALAERELTRLPVLFKTGRLARLCGLDLVQQAAISRKPLINSLGTGNCHFDQNIFFSLGFSRKDTRKLLCHNYGRPRNWAVDQKHFPFSF